VVQVWVWGLNNHGERIGRPNVGGRCVCWCGWVSLGCKEVLWRGSLHLLVWWALSHIRQMIPSSALPSSQPLPPPFRAYLSTVPHHDGCTGGSLDENNLMSPREVPTYQKAGRQCGQQKPAMSDFHYHTAPHFAPHSARSKAFPFLFGRRLFRSRTSFGPCGNMVLGFFHASSV
jgi:hypothetical protein